MASRPRPNPEQRLSAIWKSIYETPHGRVAIAEFLVSANLYSEIQTNDPVTMALAVGERNMAARLARLVGLKPENYASDARDSADTVSRFVDASDASMFNADTF